MCFTRSAQVIFALVSLLGVAAFLNVVRAESYAFIGDVVIGLAWVWVTSLLPVVIHELGYALTVKHFGCEVPRGG